MIRFDENCLIQAHNLSHCHQISYLRESGDGLPLSHHDSKLIKASDFLVDFRGVVISSLLN